MRVISGCGILGILRKEAASKIRAEETLSSIECVRYRGSRYGAGFAAYNLDNSQNGYNKVKVFVNSLEAVEHVKQVLMDYAKANIVDAVFEIPLGNGFGSWTAYVEAAENLLRKSVDRLNYELLNAGIKGRVYSWGRFVEVFKGVGYPVDVCNRYGLVERQIEADLWIAHTRQPTNSPGFYPIWSHPFSSHEWAIAHNGDISSFGANMEFIKNRGFRSFVGTDSELIVYILDYLTNIKHIPLEKAAKAIVNPFEDEIINGEAGISLHDYVWGRGAWLDGPFSVVAGYCDGDDVYMLAMADRSKFRPLVVGEDSRRIYVASEEAEIRALSEEARTWTVKPGGISLASMKRGVIEPGREHVAAFFPVVEKRTVAGDFIDAYGLGYSQVNSLVSQLFQKGVKEVNVVNVNGHRYLGINVPKGCRLNLYGTPGNCLANFNKGGEIVVYGDSQDDVADAMHDGRVIIHGNAGDVLAQAFQGGEIFVRGSAGNRVGIQMRQYLENRPYLIIGGRVDDYLGEYMAGGVIAVLGLDALHTDECLVGRYVATGMVGGIIYVRGHVERWRIGLQPPVSDVKSYLKGLFLQGQIDETAYNKFKDMKKITLDILKQTLPEKPFQQISKLFKTKYYKELVVEHRQLSQRDEKILNPALRKFFKEFSLDESLYQRIINEEFTVIKVASTAMPKITDVEEG
ncbi:MAG: hypothetical protein QXG52_01230 [Candidatus Caldarchaeum sp.]